MEAHIRKVTRDMKLICRFDDGEMDKDELRTLVANVGLIDPLWPADNEPTKGGQHSRLVHLVPEGLDWEVRPDIVEQYFGSKKTFLEHKKQFMVRQFDFDGSFTEDVYNYDKVPSKVMLEFPMIFSKEEIEMRQVQEWLNKEM